MEGRETTATVSRLLTARLAIGLGALAFALNIAALLLVASAGHTAPEPGS